MTAGVWRSSSQSPSSAKKTKSRRNDQKQKQRFIRSLNGARDKKIYKRTFQVREYKVDIMLVLLNRRIHMQDYSVIQFGPATVLNSPRIFRNVSFEPVRRPHEKKKYFIKIPYVKIIPLKSPYVPRLSLCFHGQKCSANMFTFRFRYF